MQQAAPSYDEIALLLRLHPLYKEKFPMKTEKLVQLAIKQTVTIVAVLFFIPLIGVMATLLLMTLSNLFCEQLHSLMTLSVVATSIFLAVQEFRRSTNS
jgi:hypothetical protein